MKTRIHLKSSLLAGLMLSAIMGCNHPVPNKPSVEGRWTGFDIARPDATLMVQFDAGQFAYWDSESNELGSGTYRVNDAVQPPQMDLTFQTSVATDYVGQVALAIYEFDGDELRMAGCEPGVPDRPSDFNGGQGIRVFSWQREQRANNSP